MAAKITAKRARELGIEVPQDSPKANLPPVDPKVFQRRFMDLCRLHDIPDPHFEYRFDPRRMFRFDMAWPESLISLECQGGIWTGGRHVRGKYLLDEHEKLNQAAILGWRIFYCTPRDIEKCSIFPLLQRVLPRRHGGVRG